MKAELNLLWPVGVFVHSGRWGVENCKMFDERVGNGRPTSWGDEDDTANRQPKTDSRRSKIDNRRSKIDDRQTGTENR